MKTFFLFIFNSFFMKTSIKFSKIVIKTFLLLLVIHLTVSCSNPKTDATSQNAEKPEKMAESIEINGMVTAVTFGKDGYTADVQTETAGIYAALVSIVNVGGHENYLQSNVGDKVTFKGIPSVLAGVKHLKVEKIINITASQTKTQVLAAQYGKIQPTEYCWQVNKVLNLQKMPDSKSKMEGKHFAGETLKVLGTKMVNDQLWVNVTYNLKIKAGYEDQFADGQVMSSGSPTGWIGGADVPEISCK
jgi:hypothetical protein